MSPIYGGVDPEDHRFPRVSGDEPVTTDVKNVKIEFSPRERG